MTDEVRTHYGDDTPLDARWYVVHTYSGYENKVKEDLEKTIENRNLQDLILEVKYPGHGAQGGFKEAQDGASQGVPRLCHGQNGHERQHMVYCSQHPRRYRLCRPGKQADSPHR